MVSFSSEKEGPILREGVGPLWFGSPFSVVLRGSVFSPGRSFEEVEVPTLRREGMTFCRSKV